jgi:hypothetical protein
VADKASLIIFGQYNEDEVQMSPDPQSTDVLPEPEVGQRGAKIRSSSGAANLQAQAADFTDNMEQIPPQPPKKAHTPQCHNA